MGTKESVSITPTGLVWNTNMAAVLLFWNTNMAAVTSGEKPYREILNHVYIKLYHVIKFALYSGLTVVIISTLE